MNNLVLNGGTWSVQNGVVSNIAMNSVKLVSDTNIKVDVDIVNEKMDNILEANIVDPSANSFTPDANINISDMRLVNEADKANATILFTDVTGLSVNNVDSAVRTVEGSVYKYNVNKVHSSMVSKSLLMA